MSGAPQVQYCHLVFDLSHCSRLKVSAAVGSASITTVPCVSWSRSDSNVSNGVSAVTEVPAAPPLSPVEVEKAAATIQSHFRKFQQKKQKNGN